MLTPVLITFKRSCVFVGETSMNILWKGSDERPFLRAYILSFFFLFNTWYEDLVRPHDIIDSISSGSQKKCIYSNHFSAESLCHCDMIYVDLPYIPVRSKSLPAVIWGFYVETWERLFFPFQRIEKLICSRVVCFTYHGILSLVFLFSMHDFNPDFFFISCYSCRNFLPFENYTRTISFILEYACKSLTLIYSVKYYLILFFFCHPFSSLIFLLNHEHRKLTNQIFQNPVK